MGQWVPAGMNGYLMEADQSPDPELAEGSAIPQNVLERSPLRVIKDPYPTYSAVALDQQHNEIVLQDENLFQIMVYDRMTNTPATAQMSEPKRVIGGHHTKIEFNCGLYVDP